MGGAAPGAGQRRTMGAKSSILDKNSRKVASFFAGMRASIGFSATTPFRWGASVSFAPSRFIASGCWLPSGLISCSTTASRSSMFSASAFGGGWVLSAILGL